MTRVLRWVSFCFTSCEPTDRRTNIWLCCCHSVLIAPSIKVSCCDGDEKPKSWPYHDRVWLMGCGSSAVMHVSFLHTSLLASKPKVFFKTFPQSIIHRDLCLICVLCKQQMGSTAFLLVSLPRAFANMNIWHCEAGLSLASYFVNSCIPVCCWADLWCSTMLRRLTAFFNFLALQTVCLTVNGLSSKSLQMVLYPLPVSSASTSIVLPETCCEEQTLTDPWSLRKTGCPWTPDWGL